MLLTDHSRCRLMHTADSWTVPRDYFDPLYRYLVYGYEPGSFWSAVLANDLMRAMQSSHPSNSIPALKHTTGWIQDRWPCPSWGTYAAVKQWSALRTEQRRSELELAGLIFTEREELELALRGVETSEPMMG
jgi:hypothetical protein